ncbi:tripartite tricarboxylate transporter TctB family protein [Loktanella sp. SALINAS62]|uniref:tripartite tricarboxylate transporter TctB family protein n=1 Tax=Loktanella sp. SALINAS62 TaxID=2706124 RepID=UPI001B8C0114|nr:tripartite tricarboxylate transporter TctB family protein [Loktanella sp. SALINAS62]MBS1302674.1 tripartite tricarboxylate transporter TctB family protein [Loktanella sp. SALINAS62]
MENLTRVTIDFDTSHLIFPIMIGVILSLLGLAILIRDRAAIMSSGQMWATTFRDMDKPRFFGALAITIVYFLAMVPVGNIWPNAGYGFLICSVPYVIALGLLFMHSRSRAAIGSMLAVAIIAPPVVWWLFSEVFFLTLP